MKYLLYAGVIVASLSVGDDAVARSKNKATEMPLGWYNVDLNKQEARYWVDYDGSCKLELPASKTTVYDKGCDNITEGIYNAPRFGSGKEYNREALLKAKRASNFDRLLREARRLARFQLVRLNNGEHTTIIKELDDILAPYRK